MAATATAVSGDRCRASWNSCTMLSDPLATANMQKQYEAHALVLEKGEACINFDGQCTCALSSNQVCMSSLHACGNTTCRPCHHVVSWLRACVLGVGVSWLRACLLGVGVFLRCTWILSPAHCKCWTFMVPCDWGFPKPCACSGVRSGRRCMLSVNGCSRMLLSLRRTRRVAHIATIRVCILGFFRYGRCCGPCGGVTCVPSFPLPLLCKRARANHGPWCSNDSKHQRRTKHQHQLPSSSRNILMLRRSMEFCMTQSYQCWRLRP